MGLHSFRPKKRDLDPAISTMAAGLYDSISVPLVEMDIVPANIRKNVNIFGVIGNNPSKMREVPPTNTMWGTADDPTTDSGINTYTFRRKIYTDNGDNTVTDESTGLMWIKNLPLAGFVDDARYTQAAGCAACEALDYAGYTDWRLPSIKEMLTLNDYHLSSCISGLFTLPTLPSVATGCVAFVTSTHNGDPQFTKLDACIGWSPTSVFSGTFSWGKPAYQNRGASLSIWPVRGPG